MEDWKAKLAPLKERLVTNGKKLGRLLKEKGGQLGRWLLANGKRLGKWLWTNVKRFGRWLLANGKRLGGLLWERSEPLRRWMAERRERLIPAAVFLTVSLAVFTTGNILLPGPAAQVAGRYLDAAFTYDYMELYSLFDQAVLEGELERSGLTPAGMATVAAENGSRVERYVAQVERDYGVEISYSYRTGRERALTARELEELQRLYDADGLRVELVEARRARVSVVARLEGEDAHAELRRELEVTAIRTGRGWSLDRDSMHAFLSVIYDLPDFAQENFGT